MESPFCRCWLLAALAVACSWDWATNARMPTGHYLAVNPARRVVPYAASRPAVLEPSVNRDPGSVRMRRATAAPTVVLVAQVGASMRQGPPSGVRAALAA